MIATAEPEARAGIGVPRTIHNPLTERSNRAMAAAFDRRLPVPGADPLRRSEVMQKIVPLSELRKYYGDVDVATKALRVDNPNPTVQGYVAAAADFGDPSGLTASQARALNGIDGSWAGYAKYGDPNDPLVSLSFRVRTQPDVPHVPGAIPGVRDPQTNHVAGTRRTSGGVREGTLDPGEHRCAAPAERWAGKASPTAGSATPGVRGRGCWRSSSPCQGSPGRCSRSRPPSST